MSSSAEVPPPERPDEPESPAAEPHAAEPHAVEPERSAEEASARDDELVQEDEPAKEAKTAQEDENELGDEAAQEDENELGDEAAQDEPEQEAEAAQEDEPFQLMKLEPDKILLTCERLQRRIDERFPGSGLSKVCAQLNELARHAEATATAIHEPERPWQLLRWSVIGLIVIALIGALIAVIDNSPNATNLTFADLVQVGESTVNDVILLGGAIWFFWSLDTRRKRTKVVHAVNQLRTVAHLVDVHQLTKSPETLGLRDHDTASSPKRNLTAYEMNRYLDYCSEMLSLISKIGALYSEAFDDSEALEAVSELESFANGVQDRLWQKIILLHSQVDSRDGALGPKRPH